MARNLSYVPALYRRVQPDRRSDIQQILRRRLKRLPGFRRRRRLGPAAKRAGQKVKLARMPNDRRGISPPLIMALPWEPGPV